MRIRPRLVDAGLAAGSAAVTTVFLFSPSVAAATDTRIAGSRWWVAPLLLVPAIALLFRRTHPLACVVAVWVPIAVHALLSGQGGEGPYFLWPVWASLYALGAYGSRRAVVIGVPLVLICMLVHDWNEPGAWRAGAADAWSAAFWDLLAFLPPLIGGLVAGNRRARALAVENALAETRARAAVAEERTRIARELHDVVTHHVNVVVLQAMAASGVLDVDAERARESLQVVERSGREALAEMRRLLGVLRDDEGERSLAPQPGVDDLGHLVSSAATGGMDVGLAVSGAPRRLPDGLALTLYRIVQEALTNASRHAAGARVGVSLRYEPDAVDVAVVDQGGVERSGDHGMTGGRGLIGMRERVAAFAGTLEAGPGPDGGFAVHVHLPAPPEAP